MLSTGFVQSFVQQSWCSRELRQPLLAPPMEKRRQRPQSPDWLFKAPQALSPHRSVSRFVCSSNVLEKPKAARGRGMAQQL